MPVQKISVAAVQDEAESAKNANGAEKKEADVSETAPSVKSTKSTPGSKDKRRRSFNRTKSKSGISKVSSVSSGLGESRRPDTPPPQNMCRICHCEGEEDMPLITPCLCTGTMRWVHAECLNTWIRSSDTICCELCMYVFIMQTELKPLSKWEGLQMSSGEVKKILVSVFFHVLSVLCMVVSVIALVKRTMDEIELGMDHDMWRTDMGRPYEINGKEQLVLEWPFWTKVTVVGFGVISSMVFGYIQWKYWKDMFRRLRAFNRIITVQNCEENHTPAPSPPTNAPANGKAESVEVPIGEASNVARAPLLVAERGVGAAVAPVESPV